MSSLLVKVEILVNMLMSYATGGPADDREYSDLRRELLAQPRIKEKLPRFLYSCRSLQEFWPFIKGKFATYAERRAFLREQFDELLIMLEMENVSPTEDTTETVLSSVDSDHVSEAWRRASERRESDPSGAITMARTLLETVCKHILDDFSVEYGPDTDLPKLYHLAVSQLDLAPNQQVERVLRQILGGCQTVVEGVGALRNRFGDSHGRGRSDVTPDPVYAELAVNLAGSLAVFLVRRWKGSDL